MNQPSRYPWASITATVAIAAIAYALATMYGSERVAEARREAASLQQARLDSAALRLEDYLGKAVQLAQVAVTVLGNDRSQADLERDLRRLLAASNRNSIYGIGAFFEPYSFDARVGRYGIYADTSGARHDRLAVVDSQSRYDYVWRPWYIAAQGNRNHVVFTGPYVSDSKLSFIGASEAFGTPGGRNGVVLVEALQSVLAQMLARMQSSGDMLWVTDADGSIIVLAGHGTPSSIDNVAHAHLQLAPWTLHVASVFPEVARAERAALLVGAPLTVAYWAIVGLIVAQLIRVRRLQLQTMDLREAASRDPLTGLRNRAYVLSYLEDALGAVRERSGRRFGILFVDLDRFAVVNDSLGHAVGDRLLCGIAERMVSILPDGAELGRIGGDEFLAYLPSAGQVAAELVADRLIGALKQPFTVDGREMYISASIGILLSAERYENAGELLRDADTAMYAAKSAGRGRFTVFDERMRENVLARHSLENALRRAVERNEVFARYQPIVSLRTGRVASVEALARWTNDRGEAISPATFIPLAEQSGTIDAIDSIVLEQACTDGKRFAQRFAGMTIGVNVSATRLNRGDVIAAIDRILNRTGFDARSLKIELTETAIMEHAEEGFAVLERLRALGAQVVIDDFGTGHSSLSYVQRLPVAGLKIDRSFVAPMARDRQSLAIVRAIVALAKTLGLYVVAEGIEDEEQLEKLREMGVDYGQGFYFSQALDAAAFEAFVASRERLYTAAPGNVATAS